MKAKDLRGAVALHSKYLELLNNYELLKSGVDDLEITIRGKYQSYGFKSRVKVAVLSVLMEDISNLKEELSELGVEV